MPHTGLVNPFQRRHEGVRQGKNERERGREREEGGRRIGREEDEER